MNAEQQRQVAVNAFFFQDLGRADALPGGGDLDQNAFPRNAGLFVLLDDRARLPTVASVS